MANPKKLAAVALLLAAASLAAVLLLCSTGRGDGDGRVGMPWAASITAVPFSPMDVLPLLPRGVAMAALRVLRGASDIFPVFVGAAMAGGPGAASDSGGRLEWKGACFYQNEAWLEFHNNSGSRYGGGTLHIKVRPFQSKLQISDFHLIGGESQKDNIVLLSAEQTIDPATLLPQSCVSTH